MSRKRNIGDDRAMTAAAAAWMAQRDDGLSAQQQADYARWLAEDPRHAEAIARLESAWRALEGLKDYRRDARSQADPDLLAAPRPAPVVRFFKAAGIAAAAAIVVGGFSWLAWFGSHPRIETEHRYQTGAGGYQRMRLPDGTIVQMNADTDLRVFFSAGERRIRLAKGEANFEVARKRNRPFRVEVGSVMAQAIGTAFDVRLNGRAVEVLVTSGRVQVSSSDAPADTAPIVARGQRATVPLGERKGPAVDTLPQAFLENALSWQGSRLNFVDQPLSDVIAEFNRRNRVQIVLGDSNLGSLLINGSFRTENVDSFVHLIEASFDLAAERTPENAIILRRKP